jgi:hypothetical protein
VESHQKKHSLYSPINLPVYKSLIVRLLVARRQHAEEARAKDDNAIRMAFADRITDSPPRLLFPALGMVFPGNFAVSGQNESSQELATGFSFPSLSLRFNRYFAPSVPAYTIFI